MPVTERTYRALAAEAFPDVQWELACGRLREKPAMTLRHNTVGLALVHMLQGQLDFDRYHVSYNAARLRLPDGSHFIPDVVVIPVAAMEGRWDETGVEAYVNPMPLVVEIWSPSTGSYDAREKLSGYRDRDDAESWLVDIPARSLTTFVRGTGGTYTQLRYGREIVVPAALPDLRVDLDAVFRSARL